MQGDTSVDKQGSAAARFLDQQGSNATDSRIKKEEEDETMERKRSRDEMDFPDAAAMPPSSETQMPVAFTASDIQQFLTPPNGGYTFDPMMQQQPMMQQPHQQHHATKRGGDLVLPTKEEFSRMSRSERKRFREKKRRSDVNKGFDDLMNLLIKVDPGVKKEVEDHDKCRKSQNKLAHHDSDNAVLNRVDLISRATTVLDRIYRENEENKALVAELSQKEGPDSEAAARRAIKDNRVLMMVPFLTPIAGSGAQHDTRRFTGVQQAPKPMAQSHLGAGGVMQDVSGGAHFQGFAQGAYSHAQQQQPYYPQGFPTRTRPENAGVHPEMDQRYFRSMYGAGGMGQQTGQGSMGQHGQMGL